MIKINLETTVTCEKRECIEGTLSVRGDVDMVKDEIYVILKYLNKNCPDATELALEKLINEMCNDCDHDEA